MGGLFYYQNKPVRVSRARIEIFWVQQILRVFIFLFTKCKKKCKLDIKNIVGKEERDFDLYSKGDKGVFEG